MTRFSDSLTGWGTFIGSTLTALSLLILLIGYAVRMEAAIGNCTRRRARGKPGRRNIRERF